MRVAEAACAADAPPIANCHNSEAQFGVAYTNPSFDTLNVNTLSTNVGPGAGTLGIELRAFGGNGGSGPIGFPTGGGGHTGDPGGAATIHYSGAPFTVFTNGASGIHGISHGGNGGTGGTGSAGLVGFGGNGGNGGGGGTVTITSAGGDLDHRDTCTWHPRQNSRRQWRPGRNRPRSRWRRGRRRQRSGRRRRQYHELQRHSHFRDLFARHLCAKHGWKGWPRR